MCTNDANSSLNALIGAGADAPVVTIQYGPYMNWGRWNHNTRRIAALLEAFAKANISVQLQHDDVETTWQDHGKVSVILADGTVIASEPHAQHNRNYSSIPATMARMADMAVRALKAGLGSASGAKGTVKSAGIAHAADLASSDVAAAAN